MVKTGLYFKVNNAWVDAHDRYGISVDATTMSKLLTPAPHKEPVQNKNMAMHGTSIQGNVNYKDVRSVSLPLYLCASTEADFLTKYELFCQQVLDTGWVHVKVVRPSKNYFYHFRYVDCQPFSEYHMEMASFTLSLEEPNPANRTE